MTVATLNNTVLRNVDMITSGECDALKWETLAGRLAELSNSLARPAGYKHTILQHNAHVTSLDFMSYLGVTQSFLCFLAPICVRVMLRRSEKSHEDMAIKHTMTRKSYWRLSRTPGMRIAMPNRWLHDQGLLSLKQLWCDLAPLRGTA